MNERQQTRPSTTTVSARSAAAAAAAEPEKEPKAPIAAGALANPFGHRFGNVGVAAATRPEESMAGGDGRTPRLLRSQPPLLQAKFSPGNGGGGGGNTDHELPPEVGGVAGAQGRERFVRAQEARAHQAGRNAPQGDFNGTVHRTVPTSRWEGYANHLYSDIGGGRYNAPGQRMIYTSPSAAESIGEMHAYGGLNNQTRVEMNYSAQNDPATGRGGVADVSGNLGELGLTRGALTTEKGGGTNPFDFGWLPDRAKNFLGAQVKRYGPNPLNLLTGESPYLHSRALGQGAQEAGASALRVPSATGGNQIDVLAANTDPHQLQYLRHTPHDAAGSPQPTVVDPAHAVQHAPGSGGRGVMPAGNAPHPAGHPGLANPDFAQTSPGRTQRASGARYGAIGSGVMAGFNNFRDGEVSASDVAGVAGHTVLGAGSGLATDALERGIANRAGQRLGQGVVGRAVPGAAAGGLISAVTSGAFSTWDNADAYRNGEVSASQATANVAVDTGVGLGAGLAGAAAGAAIGSVIPVAGTAVGAVVGFGAGMLGSYLASEAAHRSGASGWAKNKLGGALANYEKPLGRAWNGISQTTHAIGESVSNAGHAVADGANRLWTGAKNTAGNAYHAVAGRAGRAVHNVADAAHSVSGAARRTWDGVSHTAGRALGGARRAAGAVVSTAGRAAHNVAGSVASGARRVASGVSQTAHRAWDGARHVAGSAGRAITNTASAAVSGAGRVINNVASGAGSAVSHAVSGAGQMVGSVASGVSNTAGRAWNAVSDWWNK